MVMEGVGKPPVPPPDTSLCRSLGEKTGSGVAAHACATSAFAGMAPPHRCGLVGRTRFERS